MARASVRMTSVMSHHFFFSVSPIRACRVCWSQMPSVDIGLSDTYLRCHRTTGQYATSSATHHLIACPLDTNRQFFFNCFIFVLYHLNQRCRRRHCSFFFGVASSGFFLLSVFMFFRSFIKLTVGREYVTLPRAHINTNEATKNSWNT